MTTVAVNPTSFSAGDAKSFSRKYNQNGIVFELDRLKGYRKPLKETGLLGTKDEKQYYRVNRAVEVFDKQTGTYIWETKKMFFRSFNEYQAFLCEEMMKKPSPYNFETEDDYKLAYEKWVERRTPPDPVRFQNQKSYDAAYSNWVNMNTRVVTLVKGPSHELELSRDSNYRQVMSE